MWGAVERFPKVSETLKQVASICDSLQALRKRGQLAGPYTSSNSSPKPAPQSLPTPGLHGVEDKEWKREQRLQRGPAKADRRPRSA